MKRVVFIHVLLLKLPFPSDILFKPQLRMQLKPCSCKSEEFRTVSEQNIWFLSLDSRSRRRTQGLLMLLFGPICWFAHGISLMYAYAWTRKKRHIRLSTSLQGQHLHLTVPKSRTRRVPQPQLSAMAKAKLAKLGKLDAAHLKEDRTKKDLGKFPIKTGSGTPYYRYDTWCLTLGLSFAA